MKKICNFIKNLIIFAYILVIIFVTICLLSYNEHKLTVFGKQTLIPIIDENLEPDYTVGDLLIVKKHKYSTIESGDVVFFYRIVANEVTINFGKVAKVDQFSETEYIFTLEGDYKFSSDNYIGNAETAVVIPKLGMILKVIESKWGFLFLGVFPSLIAFLYTLSSIITEIRVDDEDDEEEKPKKKKKKSSTSSKSNKNTEKISVDAKNEKQETVTEKVEEQQEIKQPEIEEVKEETKTEEHEEKKEEPSIEKIETKQEETKQEETKPEIKEEPKEEKNEKENKTEEIKEQKEEIKKDENSNKVSETKTMTEEQKKALIEAKLKTMTEEQKKALVEAKLKSMTEEQKRALLEAKKKKMEEQKKDK